MVQGTNGKSGGRAFIRSSRLWMLRKDFRRNYVVYFLALLVLVYYFLFHYLPMYGIIIAFQDFSPRRGVLGSPFVGLKHFSNFFSSPSLVRVVRNTLLINIYELVFSFPFPILFALMLNELRLIRFKRVVQSLTYMPHFLSLVVVCGMINEFVASNGMINQLINFFGGASVSFLGNAKYFRGVYVLSGIWQGFGWSSIIYIAAIAGVDREQYDSAMIDGAGRLRQAWNITLPGIAPTIIILLIMRIGSMMSVGHEKILLLYNPMTYETADVVSTYIYRIGILDSNYSFSSAVGVFNSVINFSLLITANYISKRVSETSLF
ncbi:MAG: ABC transporter permease subunit [Oscillospiraceae bacterium]|nr:ABC transporter permease subunit [Oscillospiraceae bacterium]